MQIETVVTGPFQANCFVVDNEAGKALILDPGAESEAISGLIKEKGLVVAAYLLTHGHMDHISVLADIYENFPAPVLIHQADLAWAFEPQNEMPPFYPVPRSLPGNAFVTAAEGDRRTDAGITYRVLGTPGHTPGGVCYFFEKDKVVFSGDTLFAGSAGRTDFPGGDMRELTLSLKRLSELPDDTAVYPGHGPATTIAGEKRTNPFLKTI
ncbi:MAG: MBL fold metallo-hydrolase [Kiritimatiellia bacterium]